LSAAPRRCPRHCVAHDTPFDCLLAANENCLIGGVDLTIEVSTVADHNDVYFDGQLRRSMAEACGAG